MKKSFFLAFSCLFLSFAPLAMASSHDSKTLHLVADEWCPYNCEPNSQFPGYMVEIAQKTFEPMGYKIEYSIMPWEQAVKGVRDGSIDGAIAPAQSDAPDLIFSDEPLGVNSNVFFTKKDSTWEYKGISSLESVSLAVSEGYTYGKELDEYIKKNSENKSRIQTSSSDDALYENVKKIQFGHVDVMLENPNVAEYKFRLINFGDGYRIAGEVKEPAYYSNLYIGFSPKRKDAKELAAALSDSVKKMRDNGELKEILDKYNVPDWK